MAKEIVKPEALKEEHLTFLDVLREAGKTNMFGARPYIQKEYPELSKEEAREILYYWMKTFEDRN